MTPRQFDATAQIVSSDLGAHLVGLMQATDSCVHLWMNRDGTDPEGDIPRTDEELFLVNVRIVPSRLAAVNQPLDASDGTLPKQLAGMLRDVAAELIAKAERVEKIPGEVSTATAKAYVLRDPDSGQILSSGLQPANVLKALVAFNQIRNQCPSLDCEPIEQHPSLHREAMELERIAEGREPS